MSGAIRVLVVDDEVHARRGLRTLLAAEPDVEVVGDAATGEEAVAHIRRLAPDLVLLDVEMHDCTGLDVVAEVGPDAMPPVIFVTAYDQYAVAAFEASAVDYLLKPFTDERFREAMQRARNLLAQSRNKSLGDQLRQLLGSGDGPQRRTERFTVRVGKKLHLFHVDQIDWVEADEYYCHLHIGRERYMIRRTMSSLECQLPSDRFARIHRSTIVNLDRVETLEPMAQGDCIVVLKDGQRLRMSRRRREALSGALANFG